jgi:hypothetical protein
MSSRRATFRRTVTLRVDYTTAQGHVWLGIVRNLSLQGLYIAHVSRHVVPAVGPGDRLTVTFVLPTGRPCTLPAVVVHADPRGCGVELQPGTPHARTPLIRYWAALD